MRINCCLWRIIFRPRPQKRCLNWRPAGGPHLPWPPSRAPVLSITPMRSAASGGCTMWRSWIGRSAGTGKTIVALHRAVFLARSQPDNRVLLTTFSDTLAHALHDKLRRLISNQPRLAERLEVLSLNAIGQRLYQAQVGPARVASEDVLRELMQSAWDECAAKLNGMKFSPSFLFSEWEEMVDAWQLDRRESYRDIKRLGR